MQGTRNHTRLWTMDATPHHDHSLNSVIDAPTIAERIKFYKASLFSPTLSTLARAIAAGYLTTFPEFTTKQLRKYTPISLATPMGHLHAKRSNLQSTKTSKQVTDSVAQLHLIEDEPSIAPPPSLHPSEPSPPVTPPQPSASKTTPMPQTHPNLVIDDSMLHHSNEFLASTPIKIPTQTHIRNKYALAIDAISQMPTGTTTPPRRSHTLHICSM